MFQNKTAGVPYFIQKFLAGQHRFFLPLNILPAQGLPDEGEPDGVGAVFINQLQRVNAGAERFGHSLALAGHNRGVYYKIGKRLFVHKLQARKNHPGVPQIYYAAVVG